MSDKRKVAMIIFRPIAEIGDEVFHRTDKANENPFIVINYCIGYVDAEGEVKDYTLGCSSDTGQVIYIKPFEIKHVEKEEVKS